MSVETDQCKLVEPLMDFDKFNLYFVTVQLVPIMDEALVLYTKYLKVQKERPQQKLQQVEQQSDRLITNIQMQIYKASSKELIGCVQREFELPNALPSLQLNSVQRSINTAAGGTAITAEALMRESLVLRDAAVAARQSNSNSSSITITIQQLLPGSKFITLAMRHYPLGQQQARLISQRLMQQQQQQHKLGKSNSSSSSYSSNSCEAAGVQLHESWLQPNCVNLKFKMPPNDTDAAAEAANAPPPNQVCSGDL